MLQGKVKREGVQKNEMSIEGGRQVHLSLYKWNPVAWTVVSKRFLAGARLPLLRGASWLGQSCPSVSLQGQDCPCNAIFRTPSEGGCSDWLVSVSIVQERANGGAWVVQSFGAGLYRRGNDYRHWSLRGGLGRNRCFVGECASHRRFRCYGERHASGVRRERDTAVSERA